MHSVSSILRKSICVFVFFLVHRVKLMRSRCLSVLLYAIEASGTGHSRVAQPVTNSKMPSCSNDDFIRFNIMTGFKDIHSVLVVFACYMRC